MPAVAVTEHGNMFSAITFHDHARERGVKPILGCEVYVAPNSRHDRGGPVSENYNHLVLLAETREGWHNLIKLVSAGYTEGFYRKPRIDKELLAKHAEGLIGLSSCLKGEIPQALTTDQTARALASAGTFRDMLGQDNFFLEMQWHGIEDQKVVNRGLAPLAQGPRPAAGRHQRRALPAARRSRAARHPALHRHGAERQRPRPPALSRRPVLPEDRRRDGADLRGRVPRGHQQHRAHRRALQRRPERRPRTTCRTSTCPRASRSTATSSTSCARGFAERLERLRTLAVGGIAPPHHRGVRAAARVRDRDDQADAVPGLLPDRLGLHPLRARAGHCRWARAAARPPAAWSRTACASPTSIRSSTTCIFERFLNPERVSLPDIDIDFCERRRGEVIEYVTRRYGRENVAQIITFGTMKAKAAVRDVARALDIPLADANKVAKLIPAALDMTLEKAVAGDAGPQGAGGQRPARSRNCSTSPAGSRAWRGTPRRTPPASSSRPARSPTTRRSTRAGATKSSRSGR